MKPTPNPDAILSTDRDFPFPARRIFEAFEKPDQLSRWWGPDGFTNTFERFEFSPGGRWVFVMHGPNGANYPNESVFREIRQSTLIVIEHLSAPWFRLRVTLTARGDHTNLRWEQEFEDAETAARLRPLVTAANEQNLDRLHSRLRNPAGASAGVRSDDPHP